MTRFKIIVCLAALLAAGVALAQAPAAADEHRFDVHVEDAPARAFFQSLVDGTQYNILVPPDVTGRVSLSLRHVTVEEVLGAARDLYGYDYKRVPTGYMILPISVQTRVFHINYLDLRRVGVSLTEVRSGQIFKTSKDQDGGNSTAGGESGTESNGNARVSATTGSAIFTKTESDFWAELEANLKAIIGDDAKHSVVINRQSGVIVLRAMPRELRDADDYLRKTESTIGRQVILEAKIVEVELNDAYQAGINWATLLKNGNQQFFGGQTNPPGGWDGNLLAPGTGVIPVQPGGLPVNQVASTALGGAFTLAASFADFSTFIQLLGVQGNTRVLSSPRISTLHNQKAVIKAGHDEFFVTGVTSNTVTGTAASTSRDIELSPFFSGVSLDVTPEVGDDGNIILHVHPTVSEVKDQVKTLTFSGETDVLPLANSQMRESDNIVKTRSGQVVVIGGLMRETRNDQNYRTPVLGSVPLLGHLFRSTRKQSGTSELVILLKTTVIGDNDWSSFVDAGNTSVEKLETKGKLK